MHKYIYIAVVVGIILLVVWTLASYLFGRTVKSPEYSVVEVRDGYEVRLYEPYITAQVKVAATYDDALNQGFRLLADYIFGNNIKQASIAMTAPVTESASEPLAMTAPVLESGDDTERTISFVMPFEYTLETLPRPNNPAVQIVPQEKRKVAVLRFSWYRGAERVAQKKALLLTLLARDGLIPKSVVEYAGYNAPLTAPWINRNEVMVEIE
jgi:hypothetical protein